MDPGTDVSPDDLKVFLQEAEELLELLDEDIIRLEQEAANGDLLQEIFRAAHTLKGSSGMLGYEEMAGLTHAMEDLLDRVRKGSLAVTAELVDALLMSLDGLKVLKDDLAAGRETTLQIAPILTALQAAADAGAEEQQAEERRADTLDHRLASDAQLAAAAEAAFSGSAGTPVLRVELRLDPESEWTSVRCFQVLNELSSRGEVIVSAPSQQEIEDEQAGHSFEALVATTVSPEELTPLVASIADVVSVTIATWEGPAEGGAAAAEGQPASGTAPQPLPEAHTRIEALAQSVRIDVDVLDALMNMVGELVIDRTRVAQISRVLSSHHKEDEEVRALSETSAHIARVVDELRESMMQVRMLPVGVLFSKFPRLVRDLARSSGKRVSLVVEGEDTEIDRTVIEEIKDPLVHLVRNAIDHGVETPEERARAGKPEMSVLRLSARHAQGQIVITLEDDGRGIDAQAIREAAVRKGLLSAEAVGRLSDSEAVDLIFEPGLSTAKRTTEVSGRGVGMDIVRRNIEALNGRSEVTTRLGEGTAFALRLPLTLATFPGLLVGAAGTVYAIPLNYVQETVRPAPDTLHAVTGRRVMNLRGTVMSLLPLGETLTGGLGPPAAARATRDDDCYVVVVKAGDSESDRPVAIAVDALVDQQEVVVKTLSDYLGRTRGIAGASILGDGQVVLILDIPTLIKAAQQQSGSEAAEAKVAAA